MARPTKEIDPEQLEKLCMIQCTKEEIAHWFNCSEDTIDRFALKNYNESFATIYKKYSADGKMSLRRMQFRLAEKNAAMAIWLGKQYLGQTDKIENTITNDSITIVSNMPTKED